MSIRSLGANCEGTISLLGIVFLLAPTKGSSAFVIATIGEKTSKGAISEEVKTFRSRSALANVLQPKTRIQKMKETFIIVNVQANFFFLKTFSAYR